MQDVPQFVVARLQEKPVAGSHPDPDLLTAFVEQSLLGGERARVMEHLAACGDCRNVIALAVPVTEIEVSPAGLGRFRSGWLSLPFLRWGALAAGIAVVIGAGVLQFSRSNQQGMVTSSHVQQAVAPPSGLNQAPSMQTPAPQTQTLMRKKELLASNFQILSAQKRATPASRDGQLPGRTGGGTAIGGGVFPIGSVPGASGHETAFASDLQSPAASPNPNSATGQPMNTPSSSEMVEVQAEAGAIAQNQIAQNQAEPPLNDRNVTNLTGFGVVKAKDPVPDQAASNSTAASQPAAFAAAPMAQSVMVRSLPRWSVSASGVLQRSFDGGSTWENVNPILNTASVGNRGAMQSANAADAAGVGQANKTGNPVASPNPAPLFRAVAAAGPEVWAGGAGSVLYHSSDGGIRWSLLIPSAAGTVPTGDIVSIQFSDPLHGKISTSTAELWTTSDAGQTWQKQP
jgi:hypothetical protein